MNVEKWIEENTDWLVCCEEDIQVVPVSELRELLKTHAIVPREPSNNQLNVMSCRLKALHGENFPSPTTTAIHVYKAGIKVAENE
ncbi:MAG: hypothetical protein ACPGUE_14690 [Marinomonas sp.]